MLVLDTPCLLLHLHFLQRKHKAEEQVWQNSQDKPATTEPLTPPKMPYLCQHNYRIFVLIEHVSKGKVYIFSISALDLEGLFLALTLPSWHYFWPN